MGKSASKRCGHSSRSRYCAIDSFPDEVLLKVFSYLTMEDRCNIARVCRRFNALVRDRALWHTIDVVQVIERHFERMIEDPVLLLFDRYHPLQMKYSLLWFLNAYAHNTRTLCLNTASRSVLEYVSNHCRHVRVLHLREYFPSAKRLLQALAHLPTKIVTLKMEFPNKFDVYLCDQENNGFLANPLARLRKLTLHGVAVDNALCTQLEQLHQLRHLDLIWCTMSKHLSLEDCPFLDVIEYLQVSCCLFISYELQILFLVEIARYGHNLVAFHFQMPNSETDVIKVDLSKIKSRYRHMLYITSVEIDMFLYELCLTKSMRLRHLYFHGNCVLSRDALEEFTSCFVNLEGLSLGDNLLGCMLLTIAKNLRHLKVMDLCSGRFSDSWLQCFDEHPSLLALRVYMNRRLSCHELCEIVTTLPNIQIVCTTQSEQLGELRHTKPNLFVTNNYAEWLKRIDKCVHGERGNQGASNKEITTSKIIFR